MCEQPLTKICGCPHLLRSSYGNETSPRASRTRGFLHYSVPFPKQALPLNKQGGGIPESDAQSGVEEVQARCRYRYSYDSAPSPSLLNDVEFRTRRDAKWQGRSRSTRQ